jgi:hypothetical protein
MDPSGHSGSRQVSSSRPRADAQVGFIFGDEPPLKRRIRPISSTSASSAFTEGAPDSNSAENGTRHVDQCAHDLASQRAKDHAAKPELQSPAIKDVAYGEMRRSADNAVGSLSYSRYHDVRITESAETAAHEEALPLFTDASPAGEKLIQCSHSQSNLIPPTTARSLFLSLCRVTQMHLFPCAKCDTRK